MALEPLWSERKGPLGILQVPVSLAYSGVPEYSPKNKVK